MSLKLALIASLATVSVAGISTGSYFLFRDNSKDDKKEDKQKTVSEQEPNSRGDSSRFKEETTPDSKPTSGEHKDGKEEDGGGSIGVGTPA